MTPTVHAPRTTIDNQHRLSRLTHTTSVQWHHHPHHTTNLTVTTRHTVPRAQQQLRSAPVSRPQRRLSLPALFSDLARLTRAVSLSAIMKFPFPDLFSSFTWSSPSPPMSSIVYPSLIVPLYLVTIYAIQYHVKHHRANKPYNVNALFGYHNLLMSFLSLVMFLGALVRGPPPRALRGLRVLAAVRAGGSAHVGLALLLVVRVLPQQVLRAVRHGVPGAEGQAGGVGRAERVPPLGGGVHGVVVGWSTACRCSSTASSSTPPCTSSCTTTSTCAPWATCPSGAPSSPSMHTAHTPHTSHITRRAERAAPASRSCTAAASLLPSLLTCAALCSSPP